jgi:outer membrane protein TolC
MASATGEELDNRKLQTLLSVRTAWLNVVYQAQAERLVEESVSTFDQLKEITRLQYRAGRGNQQDVIRAQLEKSLLEDRQKSTHTMWETALAGLKKWLGAEEAVLDLNSELPQLPEPPSEQQLRRSLENHPWLAAGKTRVKAAEKGVDYAQAQSRPGWALDLQYGYRAAERDDLATAMLLVDLPFFSGNRQDREIKASQADLTTSQSLLDDRRRVIYQRLDESLAKYRQAGERLSLYENQVLPESEQNTEASLSAYQSGVTDFNILVRARLTELQSQLQHLKLRIEKAKAQVELLYLAGG